MNPKELHNPKSYKNKSGPKRAIRAARFFASALVLLRLAMPVAHGQQTAMTFKTSPQPRYVVRPLRSVSRAALDAQVAAANTVPMWWAYTTNSGYVFRMVGKSIFTTTTSAVTTVKAPIVNVVLRFPDGEVFDPRASDPCSPAGSTYSLVVASPIFKSKSYVLGGTNVGFTQYVDAFQRANFWSYTNPTTGNTPGYHVYLGGTTNYYTNVNVPAGYGVTGTSRCGRVAGVNVDWLQGYIESVILPSLNAVGVGATQFPIILLHNTLMCDTTSCGILGYHTAFSDAFGNIQTYAVATFDSSRYYLNAPDISALSHEVAEWMDDPTGDNPTPPWGNIGQVVGCQANLEVGDPLSGVTHAVTMGNGYTYHPQEMAFAGWFYHFGSSGAVHGWFSNYGRFRGFARACPPGGTN